MLPCFLLIGVALFLVFVPALSTSTLAACERGCAPNAIFCCNTTMGGYGSVTYAHFGYGAFCGPYGVCNQYYLFL